MWRQKQAAKTQAEIIRTICAVISASATLAILGRVFEIW